MNAIFSRMNKDPWLALFCVGTAAITSNLVTCFIAKKFFEFQSASSLASEAAQQKTTPIKNLIDIRSAKWGLSAGILTAALLSGAMYIQAVTEQKF